MQLISGSKKISPKKSAKKRAVLGVAAGLANATASLLGTHAHAEEKTWDIDTAVLYYSEKDRVSAVEPVISATKTLAPEKFWNIKLVVDSLTGSTPNGATRYDDPQTFTTPSGASTYETAPGDLPVESNFHETARVALSTQYSMPLNETLKTSFGGSFSREYDYMSFGLNGNLAKDINNHNTTLSAGLAFASDIVDPVGGKPDPLTAMLPPRDQSNKDGDDSKTVTDLLLGVTQVISPTWLVQTNYSLSMQSGYLNDPYKVVSRLDSSGSESTGMPLEYLHESRPDSRTKHSLFFRSKSHHGKDNVLDLSYRFHTDDWGIDSHTFDMKFLCQINKHHYFQPRFRYYQQAAADFYTQALNAGDALPENASADSRLGEFTGTTVGFKYGYLFGDDKEINFRIETYQQDGEDEVVAGDLQQRFEMFPDLDATIVQVGYSFKF